MALTELFISGAGIAPLSMKQCTQTLEPLVQGAFYRSINGTLVFVGNPDEQRYQSIIQGEGQAPSFDQLPCGQKVEVHCLPRFSQHMTERSVILHRPFVSGSLCVVKVNGEPVAFSEEGSQAIALEDATPCRVTYRPKLQMMVKHFTLQEQEWQGVIQWSLSLEEV